MVLSFASGARAMRLAVHPELKSACIHVYLYGQRLAWLDPSSYVVISIYLAVAMKTSIMAAHGSAHCTSRLKWSSFFIARRTVTHHIAEDGHAISIALS